ncbi:hypothetical protein Q4R11_14755 [Morganella morganii]
MFSAEKRDIQLITNKINELRDDLLPPSFPRADEVEQALNLIKFHLRHIETGFDNAERAIIDLEEQLS